MDSSQNNGGYVSQFGLFGPTVMIKDGFNIDLKNKNGFELEFSTENIEHEDDEKYIDGDYDCSKAYFDGMNKFSYILENDDSSDEDNPDGLSWFKRMSLKMQNVTDDGGVKKLIKKEGVEGVVPSGSRVRVHYNGYIEDINDPFDSTSLRNKGLQITIGNGEVILGLEIGISTMRKNEIARFLISPDYGYGKLGSPPRLPGDVTLLFEVELLSFNNCTVMDAFDEMTEEEKRSVSFERLLSVAKNVNLEGNEYYHSENYGKAISFYLKTINTLESANLRCQEDEDEVVKVCLKAYLNMALCYLKKANFGKAMAASRKVLEKNTAHPKALYVYGKSLRHMGDFKNARKYLLRAHSASPKSKDIMIELHRLEEIKSKCKLVEKSMCEKMLAFKM